MVIDDLHVRCVLGFPPKTHTILIIDPDAVLAFSVSLERLETISSDFPKILNRCRGAQASEFDLRFVVKPRWQKPQRFLTGSPSHSRKMPRIVSNKGPIVPASLWTRSMSSENRCGSAKKSL
jgi:hypothetical protein